MKFEIVTVWKSLTPSIVDELVVFWRDNNAIVDATAATARACQAICVARDEAGAICGVSTAVIKVLPRLRQPMYYYRQYFAKSMRGRSQFIPFYKHARNALQDYNASMQKPESLGVLMETENAKISSAYNHAHEPVFNATFIGYSPRGTHMYVSYFDGAVLQPPAPIRAPVSAANAANLSSIQATPRRTTGRS